jgi:C-terminal processing protease CtpA/Prc
VRIGTLNSNGQSKELWSAPRAEQTFLEKAPLFILIDENSASAAEASAYHLKHLGRATIVGEASYGAAHLSSTIALEIWDDAEEVRIGAYSIILPKAEIININAERSWEGTGVLPHVVVEGDKALGKAHALAIAAAHPDAGWAKTMIASVAASYEPAELTFDALERLAGNYERNRKYRVQDGRLYTSSGAGDELELLPITATSFRYKSGISATVEFDVGSDGQIEAARIVFPDGGFERFARLE